MTTIHQINQRVPFLIADCDRRIGDNAKLIQDGKRAEELFKILTPIVGKGKGIEGKAVVMASARVKHLEKGNELVKLEKLMYQAIQKGNFALLPVLKNKYMDEMTTALDSSGNLVELGVMKEGEHLFFADGAKKQAEYMTVICDPSGYGN
jgi:hypothetical protein